MQRSLTVHKTAYSESVPKPGNRTIVAGRVSDVENTSRCMAMAGLTLALVCVAAAGQLVVIQ